MGIGSQLLFQIDILSFDLNQWMIIFLFVLMYYIFAQIYSFGGAKYYPSGYGYGEGDGSSNESNCRR